MKTKIFTLLFAIMASTSVLFAESGTCGSNLTWSFQDGVLTISGTGAMDDYESLEPAPWSSLNSSILSVTICNGVTRIGNYAFYKSANLSSIEISNTVTEIGSAALASCTSLTSITISSSVTSIGSIAFRDCPQLSTIDVANDNPNYSSESGVLFDKYKTILIQYPASKSSTSYIIPNSVTNIGNAAFYKSSNLTSVTIPNGVTDIELSAFSNCTNLSSIEIPNTVINIGNRVFERCTGLTSVIIPNSVTSMGEYVFCNCTGLISVTIGNGVPSIGYAAFWKCSNLKSITIGNSVSSTGYFAFADCTSLEEVHISDITAWCNISFDATAGNPLNIAKHLYLNDSEITNLIIPNGVTRIGGDTFRGCTSFTSVTIPNSVTRIDNYAFLGCTGLTSITCKSINPPTIYDYTFRNLYSIPLYVPCESVDDYQSASYWTNFTNIQGYDCSYSRSMTTGKYGTICIPKAVNAEDVEGGVFFNIVYAVTNTSDEVTGILMEEVTGNLVAGKSYIFRATDDELVLTYTGSSVEDPIEATGLVGNLDEDPIDVPQGMYVLSNNQIRKLNGGSATIGQNRAYIDLTSVTKLNYVPAAAPGRIMLYVEDNNPVVTDVKNNTIEKKPAKILKDGMILIIRDGKTYDMLGNTH